MASKPKTPTASSSLTAPAKNFAGLVTRLNGLHAAMKANPSFTVKRFEVRPPFRGSLPGALDAFADFAAAFDGATFEWELRGTERTAGALKIPSIVEIAKSKGQGTYEEGDSLVLLPDLKHASVELLLDTEDVSVFDRESGVAKTEGIDVLSAIDAAIDSLGIRGWELRFYDDLDETEDDDEGDGLYAAQGNVLDAVDRAWAALGLRAP